MMASIAKTVGGVFEIVSAVANAWVMIAVGGIALPIALAFAYAPRPERRTPRDAPRASPRSLVRL